MSDYTLLPTILKIAPKCPRLKGIIVLTDRFVFVSQAVGWCVWVRQPGTPLLAAIALLRQVAAAVGSLRPTNDAGGQIPPSPRL